MLVLKICKNKNNISQFVIILAAYNKPELLLKNGKIINVKNYYCI